MTKLFIGSDVSKGYSDFIILNENQESVVDNFQLDDTFTGHSALSKQIAGLFKEYNDLELFVGFESTGGYENNWLKLCADLSEEYNIKLTRLNPIGVHYQQKADLKKITTDRESARGIAEYMILHRNKIRFNEKNDFEDLRKHWQFLKLLKKQFNQLRNQLEKCVYLAQPQLMTYFKDKTPDWVYAVLFKYPTARKLARAAQQSLAKIPYVSTKKAIKLIQQARTSIASLNSQSGELLIRELVSQILSTKKAIKNQEQIIMNSIDSPEIEILKSFIGISDTTAYGLMLEIGRIQRFSSAKSLASFFGLHPVYKQSGDGIYCMRMSKHGRAEGRALLFNVAMSAITRNPWIKTLYQEYLQNGKAKLSAIGIIMHKISRIIYGMLKNKNNYDPLIDKKNRDKNLEKIINHESNSTRRFQPHDQDAPISARQNRKRKKQGVSQNVRDIPYGITSPAQNTILKHPESKCN